MVFRSDSRFDHKHENTPRYYPTMLDFNGKRVTVMGLGRFGGGIGVTRWLAAQGADIIVTDLEPESELNDSVSAIRPLIDSGRVTLRLGGHNVSDFTTVNAVIANPAVPRPWDNRFLRAASAANIPVTTEIRLLVERLPSTRRVIGVTGSVGKSTTSAMIAHALNAVGRRAQLGGNIGGSLLESLDTLAADDWMVLELSSFMLYWLEDVFAKETRSPHIAVLTNISPNHLDWHASPSHYESCKRFIYQFQSPSDAVVFGPSLAELATRCTQRSVVVDSSTFREPLCVPGAHNTENAATALAACSFACPDISERDFTHALASFAGLPHRLQLVREWNRRGAAPFIRFYNDSKSTTPESALRAVSALAEMPSMSPARIHLIAGGYDKGSDLTPIAQLASRLGGLYTIGATGPSIAAAVPEGGIVHECNTLAAAVQSARSRLRPGDVLLLSPACASWDHYSNYEARGNEFVDLVNQLAD